MPVSAENGIVLRFTGVKPVFALLAQTALFFLRAGLARIKEPPRQEIKTAVFYVPCKNRAFRILILMRNGKILPLRIEI